METATLLIKLNNLVYGCLVNNCPVMSGNMQSRLHYHQVTPRKIEIVITAPTYDIALWKRTGQIRLDGKGDYALSVNRLGAFNGKSRKSQHWVDKTIELAVRTMASLVNAEVDNKMGE